MTSHELAQKLLSLPDVLVTRNGYEGGVEEITSVTQVRDLVLNVHEEWYYGKHEYMGKILIELEGKTITKAIHIG